MGEIDHMTSNGLMNDVHRSMFPSLISKLRDISETYTPHTLWIESNNFAVSILRRVSPLQLTVNTFEMLTY